MQSINNNPIALKTAGALNEHYSRLTTSIRRLSSGLRINSSADDAAGLAIRELMRADISASMQGIRNANDAISLLQVADGALGIIDEKLIRMKELAEQAATGTYDSTQRLMIHSEFQAMAREIDRIANATDFNGIKLLDGSLSAPHSGARLNAHGAMKIHFGTANDSAEDYYYISISDCSTKGLGLRTVNDNTATASNEMLVDGNNPQTVESKAANPVIRNDYVQHNTTIRMPASGLTAMQDFFPVQNEWYSTVSSTGGDTNNFMFLIPKGSKNILINASGGRINSINQAAYNQIDNDLQLFTRTGVHLAGTPQSDYVWDSSQFPNTVNKNDFTTIDANSARLGFTSAQYDASNLNSGPANYDYSGNTLAYSTYNGMTIGYSGDPEAHRYVPASVWHDYEVITIDEATEDLVLWFQGVGRGFMKVVWDNPDAIQQPPVIPDPPDPSPGQEINPDIDDALLGIETQEKAQKALVSIQDAIVAKDTVRAHLGAMQNRLENTVSNISIQATNLTAAESRISDADVALEMMEFVRNQVLTQSAVAMLGQANSYPSMLARLLNG